MKKIILILLLLLLVSACSANTNQSAINDSSETNDVAMAYENNHHLYQDWSLVPLLTDDSYFDFYISYQDASMGEQHQELVNVDYYKISDMLYHAEYSESNAESFTLKQSIYGLDDGIKYDEMYQTRLYDMTVVKDESYWIDYDDSGEVLGIYLSIMEYGNHAPYTLISSYSLEDNQFICDKNDLSNEYPDNGEKAIQDFLASFEKETIDIEQITNDLETDLYFYNEDQENDYSCYIGPNSLQMLFTNIDVDEDGSYIRAFLANGIDCKLYINEQKLVTKIVQGNKIITYEYFSDYVVATYKQSGKDDIVYKYDYERNLLTD